MDYTLTDEEISLLKELKGAGARGRIVPQAQSALAHLLRAGYVKRHATKAATDRYVITTIGAMALSDAIA
jgi:hypothetical protein